MGGAGQGLFEREVREVGTGGRRCVLVGPAFVVHRRASSKCRVIAVAVRSPAGGRLLACEFRFHPGEVAFAAKDVGVPVAQPPPARFEDGLVVRGRQVGPAQQVPGRGEFVPGGDGVGVVRPQVAFVELPDVGTLVLRPLQALGVGLVVADQPGAFVAGHEHIGVLGPQHLEVSAYGVLDGLLRFPGVPGLAQGPGEGHPGGEGVQVVLTGQLLDLPQYGPQFRDGLLVPAAFVGEDRQVVPDAQDAARVGPGLQAHGQGGP